MTTSEFAPMSVGQILDRSFRLYRTNFVRYVSIVAVMQVPVFLVSVVLTILLVGTLLAGGHGGGRSTAGAAIVPGMVVGLVMVVLAVIAHALCQGALFKSVSESYLGKDVTLGEAYGFVLGKLGRIVWASILVGVVVMLGLALCIVPGVIFGLWFGLTIPVIIVENLEATGAMRRSKGLVLGNLGRAFGLGLVIVLIGMIMGWVCGGVGRLIGGAAAPGNVAGIFTNQIVSLVGQILVAPIGAAAYVLFYYDLRIRKEAFDLEMLAKSMGTPGPTAGSGTPTA